MKILCINTAFSNAQIALDIDGKTSFVEMSANAKTSESVMPKIDEVLSQNGIKIGDVDVIGIVVGTGSFTGVRIGTALVKGFGMCFSKIKICAINSLNLMAFEWCQNNKESKNFFTVQNALSGRFFVGSYNKNGEKRKECELVSVLPKGKKIGLVEESLSETDEKISFTPQNLLAYTKLLMEKEEFTDVKKLAPIYLRLSQAEESLLEKEKNA